MQHSESTKTKIFLICTQQQNLYSFKEVFVLHNLFIFICKRALFRYEYS